MESGYMVLGKDGEEYGPLDRDTIQQWYFEGRLDRSSRVWEPGGDKFKLHEVFDLTVWQNPVLVTQAAARAEAEPDFKPNEMAELSDVQNQRTPGMFAAGLLLILNGVIGFLALVVTLTWNLPDEEGARGWLVPFLDLIIAQGLLRGRETYRRWGLARGLLGGLVFLLVGVTKLFSAAPPTFPGLVEIFFQLVFCAGMTALLYGDWPSTLRVRVGVAAVLVAWSGLITTEVVAGFMAGFKESQELQKATVAAAGTTFEDAKLGFNLQVPEGWSLLGNDNAIFKIPDATLVAVHNDSGCLAALLVEPRIIEVDSIDHYLDLVLADRKETVASMTETGRVDLDFGGNQARRLETAWSEGRQRFRGFTTTCQAGWSYYMLTGWCLDGDYAKAFSQFQKLEKALQITGTKELYFDDDDVEAAEPEEEATKQESRPEPAKRKNPR